MESKKGQQKSFSLDTHSRVIIEGTAARIEDLLAGHNVKISTAKPAQNPAIRGVIVAINHSDFTAKIKDSKTRKVVTVSLAATKVRGEVDSVAALTEGHLVTVRLK